MENLNTQQQYNQDIKDIALELIKDNFKHIEENAEDLFDYIISEASIEEDIYYNQYVIYPKYYDQVLRFTGNENAIEDIYNIDQEFNVSQYDVFIQQKVLYAMVADVTDQLRILCKEL